MNAHIQRAPRPSAASLPSSSSAAVSAPPNAKLAEAAQSLAGLKTTLGGQLHALRAAHADIETGSAQALARRRRADADLLRADMLEATVRDVRGALRVLDDRVSALEPQAARLRASAVEARAEWQRCVSLAERAEGVVLGHVGELERALDAIQAVQDLLT